MSIILAQTAQQQKWIDWVKNDPNGRIAGLAVAVILGLIVAIMIFKSMRWAAARANLIIGLAVAITGVYLLSIFLFHAGPVGWLAGGIVAFGMFFALALFLTVAKR